MISLICSFIGIKNVLNSLKLASNILKSPVTLCIYLILCAVFKYLSLPKLLCLSVWWFVFLASPDLQLSISKTLLELSFLSPVTVMSGSLYPWFLANKNVIPPDFVSNLEQTRQILIGQFPYLKCPAFVVEKLLECQKFCD